jgi:hypothetical protein
MGATFANRTLELIVTVLVRTALGSIPLLTVIVTSQDPTLETLSTLVVAVLEPAGMEHPAVPVVVVQEKLNGPGPDALP